MRKYIHSSVTDVELSTQTSLEHYGLNKYQVRSTKAIDRILALIALSYWKWQISEIGNANEKAPAILYHSDCAQLLSEINGILITLT